MKTIAIVSLDQVNRWDGAGWAAEVGLDPVCLSPHELMSQAPGVVICDWDFWPRGERDQVLAWFRAGGPAVCLVIKASTLDERRAEQLAREGALVWPRWDRGLFETVARLAAAPREVAAVGDTAEMAACGTAETVETVCLGADPRPSSSSVDPAGRPSSRPATSRRPRDRTK